MGFGLMLVGWGCLVCIGASKMQNLDSYTWAMVGAVLGILPVLVGIFAIAMLRNPKVIAGFEEIEGALDDDEEKEDDEDDEDEDDEDDD
jgi:sugar phosphate permease